MLVEVKTQVEPDPKTLNWTSYEQVSNTIAGGRIHVGNGQFVDSEGRPLDPESQIQDIDDEMAKLETRKKQLEELKKQVAAKPEEPAKEPVATPPVVPQATVVAPAVIEVKK